MSDKYILYPKTVVQLSEEIKTLCDNYWDKKVEEDEVKRLILHWAKNTSFLFYEGDFVEENLNKSIKKIIGKKRVELLFTLLAK